MGKRPVALIILDGFGLTDNVDGNAIKAAKTPVLDELFKRWPNTILKASGEDVGLPKGQIGNSEVGHTNIGAGRIVYQNLQRINNGIKDGSFFENEAFLKAIENAKKNSSSLHIMGLLSDGGVHSHINHLFSLIELSKKQNINRLYIHIFTDGRDVCPTSALEFYEKLQEKIKTIGLGKIATISGRYYAMDRDNRWDRIEKAYMAIVDGDGPFFDDGVKFFKDSYKNGVTDEFIVPTIFDKEGTIKENDSVIFFNFRPDRARQLTKALTFKNFNEFERKKGYLNIFFVCMSVYDETFEDVLVAYKNQPIINSFGEYISKKGLTQLRIAETEKYAHVTFFFSGGREEKFEGEDRVLIKSPDVATYDLKPEMSAFEVADKAKNLIASGKYDVIILNFANCDMVGHTGVFDAAKKAVESVDSCLKKVLSAIEEKGGVAIITADHGNAEEMISKDNSPQTAHTTNPVPFIVVYKNCRLKKIGRLCDIAPTMLYILGIEKPAQFEGESLIID